MDTTVGLLPKEAIADKPNVVVQTWNLKKVYRTGFWLNQKNESLKDCSLTVYKGETFGLLGPNGAGKTTLLKTLLGIVRPTAGRAVLLDRPIGDRQVKNRIGYLPENAYYYDYLTAWELLDFVAGLFEIPQRTRIQRINQLLDLVGLAKSAAKKKQLRKYSKGMVQRVGIAQALINDPEVVFLDEPMSGLDPLGRYQVREIILSLKEQGKTIFFNSHILADVEKICDRVAILALGDLIAYGSLEELLGSSDRYQVTVKGGTPEMLDSWIDNLGDRDNSWYGQLKTQPREFINYLANTEMQLIDLNLARPSLEEFFVRELQSRGITSSR
jgi:ABC-2 type transport system ATP-binding protein